jgi:hypothetical protein
MLHEVAAFGLLPCSRMLPQCAAACKELLRGRHHDSCEVLPVNAACVQASRVRSELQAPARV